MKEVIVNVDNYNENSIKTIEGDNLSEVYKIYICKNKRRIDLTNKIAIMAYVNEYGSKKSNILALNITNAAEGEIELPITNVISNENGVYACQIAIYGENNSLEQTAPFSLIVENNIFSKISNTAINSTDFYILSEAIKTTSEYAEKLKQGTENIELQYANKLNNLNTQLSIDSSLSKNSSISNFIEIMLSGNHCKFASLGDSITDCGNITNGVTGGASSPDKGWFSLLTKYIKNTYGYQIEGVNRGVGGHKVSQSFERIKTEIIPFDYDLIIVELGTNDWNYGTSLEQFEKDYRKLIKELKDVTRASILCVGLGWFKNYKTSYAVAEEWQYNNIIKKIALENNLGYVDMRAAMMNCGYAWEEITFSEDPVHPNDLGHEIWFNAIKQWIYFGGFMTKSDFRINEFEFAIKPEQIRSNKDISIDKNNNCYFGNSCYVNSDDKTQLYFRFYGDALKLIYTKAKNYGECTIYIDGGKSATINLDMYSEVISFNNIKEIANLELKWHFVSIIVNNKNKNSDGYGINLEGVLVRNIIKEEIFAFRDEEFKSFNKVFYEAPFPNTTCYSIGYAVINSITNKNIRVDTNPKGQGGYAAVKGY